MNQQSREKSPASTWYQKVLMVLLFPFMLLTVPLAVLAILCMGLFAVTYNYVAEYRLRSRMRQCGRFLKLPDARSRMVVEGGTLIIESPTLGWRITHAWWTPDDVVWRSPFPLPTSEDYEQAAKKMKCLDWDRWCWQEYTSHESGKAYLLRVWNGEAIEQKLERTPPLLTVVRTWTALARCPELWGGPEANAA